MKVLAAVNTDWQRLTADTYAHVAQHTKMAALSVIDAALLSAELPSDSSEANSR